MAGPKHANAVPAGTRNGAQVENPQGSGFKANSYPKGDYGTRELHADVAIVSRRLLDQHGMSAFEMPKRAAAMHEAGHVVLFAHEGEPIRSVKISSRRYGTQRYWGGLTKASSPWRIDETTDPAADLRRVRFEIAGVTAEMLLAREHYREASSLDEVIRAQRLCGIIARKLDCDPEQLRQEQYRLVRQVLLRHVATVVAIADKLEIMERLAAGQLAPLLAPMREGRA